LSSQSGERPLQALKDLAEFQIGKPTEYNNAVVDAASSWFGDGQRVTPFTVLDPLLATEGSQQSYHAHTLTFRPFPLNANAVAPIRDRVITVALKEARHQDVSRAAAGIRALSSALRYPAGMHGRPVNDEERNRWTPEFIKTIRRLGEVASREGVDPVILVAIREVLHWHAVYSDTGTQPVAAGVLQGLRADVADHVALVIHDSWRHLAQGRDRHEQNDDGRRLLEETVAELVKMPDEAVTALISERLAKERLAFGRDSGQPGALIDPLIKARPSLALKFRDLAIGGEAPALAPVLPVVLAISAELHPAGAASQARELLALADQGVTRAVAQSLSWNRGLRPLASGERELLLEFASDSDLAIREAAAMAANRLAGIAPATACDLAAAVDFSDSPQLADRVFMCFSNVVGLSWEQLTDNQKGEIRSRLVTLADIGEHWVTTQICARSAVDPDWVVKLLQDRVVYAENLGQLGDYRPTPFRWDEPLRFREQQDFIAHLRKLHAWIASAPDSWIRQDMGAEIFAQVAGPFDQVVLAVLNQALNSSSQADIQAVAAIAQKAPRTITWDSPEFVQTALRAATRFGEATRNLMSGALWTATITGIRHGAPGKPFAEDIEQRNQSRKLAHQMPRGSVEQKFYLDSAASADENIARTLAEDRPSDGRDW
jgi:hypothetical protein